jgi:hypothetical protein
MASSSRRPFGGVGSGDRAPAGFVEFNGRPFFQAAQIEKRAGVIAGSRPPLPFTPCRKPALIIAIGAAAG